MNILNLQLTKGTPKYQQIYFYIKKLILNKSLKSDTKLPSIRQLSNDLSVSRSTILSALDQLVTEGYLRVKEKKDIPSTIFRKTIVNGNLQIIRFYANKYLHIR